MTAPFSHEALFYDDLPGFLARTVPFLREGVEAGEPALVAVDRAKADALQDALPEANGHIGFVDMAELGRNPGRIISAWADFVHEHAGADRLRGIGEPVWAGRSPDEIVECQRHEALLNVAFADRPGFTLVCPYDRAHLDDSVLEGAQHSHPVLVREGAAVPSRRYDERVEPFAGTLPEPRGRVERIVISRSGLPEVRRVVAHEASATGIGAERAADLVLAVTEAVTNTLRHAGGQGVLRLWREAGALVCEVADQGRIVGPLTGRLPVAVDETGGRGLWLIHQLCDLVQVRSSDGGTVVRMHLDC